MNTGERKIFDIFNAPANQSDSINQRIQDFHDNTIALLEKPNQYYTREYLVTLTNDELNRLLRGLHQKVQYIKSDLQKYGEYNKKNTTQLDLGLSFLLVEEILSQYAKIILINSIYSEICNILTERGSINLPK